MDERFAPGEVSLPMNGKYIVHRLLFNRINNHRARAKTMIIIIVLHFQTEKPRRPNNKGNKLVGQSTVIV